ncbi:MAG: hypothetical protein M1830_008178 [Pleopsidium flavum]|nr:MAG: hypothetical protein M1830_008178 [Pleopsidium flavum]
MLLSPCVTAFYPYKTEAKLESVKKGDKNAARRSWTADSVVEGRRSLGAAGLDVPTLSIRRRAPRENVIPHLSYIQELDHISAKYRRRGIPASTAAEGTSKELLQNRATPLKRTNAYKVVTASEPSQSDSMAVNQDGTDYSYFSTVKFGSSGESLYMLVDTGAANTWVMGSDCTTKACNAHNTFGQANSGTLQVTNTPWNVTYGTGKVSGVVVNDTVSLAGFTLPIAFGSASETSNDFLTYPMDGILGLGRSKSNVMGVPTVMEALENAQLLKANLLGINLQRNSDGATDGEVNFGAVDSSKYTGDLSYTTSVSHDGLWEVPVDDAGVDNVGCKFSGRTAIIDTGTSFVLMPPGDAKKLLTQIPKIQQNGESFSIPCSSTAAVQFTFSGVTYNVSSKDYLGKPINGGNMCASNIIGRQTFGANQWLMGDAFLKNVYTVFDFDKDRIGFGVKSNAGNAQSTSSNSTPGQSFSPPSSPAQSSMTMSSSSQGTSSSSLSPLLPGSVGTTTYQSTASGTPTVTAATDTASGTPQDTSRTSGVPSSTSSAAAMPDTKASIAQTRTPLTSAFSYLVIILVIYCI